MSNAKPNLLIIMTDQHSKHFLNCYGNSIVRTPNLDRLAAEGRRFTDVYCAAPLCVPSRASFMTSRTPSHNQVWNNEHILSSGIPTWAHQLALAGYETAICGRMHFNGPDQRHGFELRLASELHARNFGVPVVGGPMWTRFSPHTSGQLRIAVEQAGRGRTHYQWFDQQATAGACDYLRGRREKTDKRPFAAMVGYMLPHCPYVGPRELFDYYYSRVDIPVVETEQPTATVRFRKNREILEPLPEERIRVARAAYYALCEFVDQQVGQVLEALQQSGEAENTLVIYTSDHGDSAGEHGCWWKSTYYESSVGVPMIARWPGIISGGTRCPAVCNLMDIGPTLAEIGGRPFETPVDGRSMLPLFQGSAAGDGRTETFSELHDTRNGDYSSRMIRRGKWKLWCYEDGKTSDIALFDLQSDPGEIHDRSADSSVAELRDDLLARVREDWNPVALLRASNEASAMSRIIGQYGRALKICHPDAIEVPPADYESDVQLL